MKNKTEYKYNHKHAAASLALFLILGYVITYFVDRASADKDFIAETKYLIVEMGSNISIDILFDDDLKIQNEANEYLDKYDKKGLTSAESDLYKKMVTAIHFYNKSVDEKQKYRFVSEETKNEFYDAESEVNKDRLL